MTPRHTAKTSLLRRAASMPLRWQATGVAAILLGVSGLFGGLAPAPVPVAPAAAVGDEISGTPWDVSVVKAVALDELDGVSLQEKGDRWIGVVARIEVTSPTSRSDVSQALELSGVEGLRPGFAGGSTVHAASVNLMRDGTALRDLNPGLPEQVAFLWEQRGDAPVPATVRVRVVNMTFRESSLGYGSQWLDPHTRAELTVDVERKDA